MDHMYITFYIFIFGLLVVGAWMSIDDWWDGSCW